VVGTALTPLSVDTPHSDKETVMLGWVLTFLVLALIAALFGFGGIASTFAGIAQILFVIFLVLLVAALIFGAVRGRRPPV